MANKLGQGNIRDLKGEKTDNFSVIERIFNKRSKISDKEFVQWKCLCNCGKEFVLTTKQFYRGQKSCGCLKTTKGKSKYTDEQAIARKVLSHYRVGARRRNIEFLLTPEQFEVLLFQNCYYCNRPPYRSCDNYLKNCGPVKVNGVDRIDNNKSYFLENCVPCCMICNRAKGNLTEQEFKDWISDLIKYENLSP